MVDVTGARITIPPQLEGVGATALQAGSNIGSELAALNSRLQALAQYWGGLAADGHHSVQQNWNTASTALSSDVGTLGDLGRAANTNWHNYVATETANTQMWANH